MLSFNILYPDLIKFYYCADTTERGVWGWKEAQKQRDFVDNSIVWVGKLEGKVKFSVESTSHCKNQKHQMGMQKEGAMVNRHLGPTLVPWSFSVRDHSQLFIFTGEFLSKSIFNLAPSLLSKGISKKKKIKSPKFHIYFLMFDGRPHSSCSGAPGLRSSRPLTIFDITPTLPNDFPCWPHIYEWLRLTNCFHFWLVSSFLLLVKKRNKMLKAPNKKLCPAWTNKKKKKN